MAQYFGPQESTSQVVRERYYLATDFISGIGYGAQAVLYVICACYLWQQRKTQQHKFLLAYMTLLFLISTVAQVAQAHRAQLIFIENRNFPGGPWAYYDQSVGGAASMVGQIASAELLILSEFFMVWRCWVVWYSVGRHIAYAVIFLPILMLFGSFITAVFYFFCAIHPASVIAGAQTTTWVTIYYTLSLSANVIVTVLILARLIAHRRSVKKSLTTTSVGEYTSVITMLIESSTFYSIIATGCLITSGVGIPVGNPFVSASISMQQISGYLIIARLAHGQAWQANTSAPSAFVVRHPTSIKTGDDGLDLGTDSMSGTGSV